MTVTDELLSPEAVDDPYAHFAALREHRPVAWNERYGSWVITRHDDVSAALKDARFSSDRLTPYMRSKLSEPDVDPELRATFEVLNDWMVFKDPPEHTRLRRLVNRAFTPRTVERMRPRVHDITAELLETLARQEQPDLIDDLAFPLPAIVIAEMLGVPAEDRSRFRVWSDQLTALVFGGLEDPGRYDAASEGMVELAGYLDDLVAEREEEPRDDLVSALVRARDQDDALTRPEIVATCTLLLFGGHETTTNLIANGILALVRHPQQLGRLRDGEVDVRTAVEELIRYDGPAKVVVRVVAEDLQLRGRDLRDGDRVFLVPASANRDPGVFSEPDRLDLTRDPNPHVGFGLGVHYCLGAPLARLEASVAVPMLLRRLRGLEVATDDLRWLPILLTRGLQELPITYGSYQPD